MKMGALNGLSIGFMPVKWSYDEATDIRTLTEIDLWEVSLVTFPANRDALISGVKATVDEIQTLKDAERHLREAGLSRSYATQVVSRIKAISVRSESDARSRQRAMAGITQAINTLKT